jgi:cellulose synthase/poly-beta-1,6-N-acetylglucosamine synthase-like glycosyltransferase
MAYNEEANIGQMMDAVLSQQLSQVDITEIAVVASGCVDRTEEIVADYAERDPRIRLLSQPHRQGKSSAVNYLLQHTKQEIIALVNADTIPAPDAIENLIAPFADPEVGMVGGRPVPTNSSDSLIGYAAHLLWALHHQMCLRKPKMGEMIAFRNFFRQIPPDSAVDEASVEPLIRGQGLRLHYAPGAVVYNRGPETVSDFLLQRRRIYAGHVYVRNTLGYRVSTMKGLRILWLLLASPGVKRDWRYFCWAPPVLVLEVYGRMLGLLSYRIWKQKHTVWEVAETTKVVPASSLEPPV